MERILVRILHVVLSRLSWLCRENISEINVERHKEKEDILEMVQNLKDDTSQLNRVISFLTLRTGKMDSLIHFSKANFTVPENFKALTRIAIQYGVSYLTLKPNNATITQLKQSGNLRLIRTGYVADSILWYVPFVYQVINP